MMLDSRIENETHCELYSVLTVVLLQNSQILLQEAIG
jgi:hypothetical protein